MADNARPVIRVIASQPASAGTMPPTTTRDTKSQKKKEIPRGPMMKQAMRMRVSSSMGAAPFG